MSRQKYVVQLADDERERLQKLVRGGVSPAREVVRARILLKADAGWTVVRIADALDVAPATVCRIKKRFLDEGLQSALEERRRPGRPPKLDEKGEAHLIALACSPAPDGHDHWTLRLLAGKAVELGVVDSISHEGIRKRLKKTNSTEQGVVHSRGERRVRGLWRTCLSTTKTTHLPAVSTRHPSSWWPIRGIEAVERYDTEYIRNHAPVHVL